MLSWQVKTSTPQISPDLSRQIIQVSDQMSPKISQQASAVMAPLQATKSFFPGDLGIVQCFQIYERKKEVLGNYDRSHPLPGNGIERYRERDTAQREIDA